MELIKAAIARGLHLIVLPLTLFGFAAGWVRNRYRKRHRIRRPAERIAAIAITPYEKIELWRME